MMTGDKNHKTCFHCALPVPTGCELTVQIEEEQRPVCCPGCKAVAELIRDTGLSRYYDLRDAPEPGVGRPPEEAAEWKVFDSPEMLDAFTESHDDMREATIYITHRLRLRFPAREASLSSHLATLADLGYQPQPLSPESTVRPEVTEQRTALKRLLVASLGMMQVMMFAVGLYSMDFQGIDPDMQHFLRLVSFFVTTPVVAVGSAYVASVYATFTRGEAVWFDSVTMFVFFLTLGRFLEMRARHRSIDRSAALSSLLPNTATRIDNEAHVVVPVSQLTTGDHVLIRAGEAIPADGVLASGATSVDEALLTGEATPQTKVVGDELSAGSVNLDSMIEMTVTSTGGDTTLGTISRLSERARYARPAFVTLADKIASYIVVALLVVATGVATFWYFNDPDRAFVITLSVLVVTCPCALALATPAAFAAAGSRLSQLRLLVTNGNAIEALSRATLAVFDKTGTLTIGLPRITAVFVTDNAWTEKDCRVIAAALEHASTHPLARAFALPDELPVVTSHEIVVGEGVRGIIHGREWRLGNASFIGGVAEANDSAATHVFLGVDENVVAWFELEDELRPNVAQTLENLRGHGVGTALVSGDNRAAVESVASRLAIDDVYYECTPEDKLAIIEAAQKRGEKVVMIGDGINDAPVLAGADTSIAPAHGALLAQTSADVIMLGDSLSPLTTAVEMSRKTMRIVRQNLAWAIVYNALALPLAAAGYVPPWAAAIGMSASSLIVVLNALRLNRFE
jgi:Cu2+-exporting ATPase